MNQRDDLDRMLSVWLDDPFTPPDVGPSDLQLSLVV